MHRFLYIIAESALEIFFLLFFKMSKKKKARAQERFEPQNSSSIKSNSPEDEAVTYRLKPAVMRATALIIVALLLLLLFAFVFVNRAGQNQNISNSTTADSSSDDSSGSDEGSTATDTTSENNDSASSVDGGGVSTGPESAITESASIKSEATANIIDTSGRWVATDYEKGEITTGKFEVKKGDTLWEIAEETYGSGFEWKKILEANKSQIGFLPNGSQALIVPGQVLELPE